MLAAVLAGSTAVAFESEPPDREGAAAIAFPSFLGEQGFLEIFAARQALADHAANAAPPHENGAIGIVAAIQPTEDVRSRAEELSQLFYRPADETDGAPPADGAGAPAADSPSSEAPPPPPSKLGAAPSGPMKASDRPAATPAPQTEAAPRARKIANAAPVAATKTPVVAASARLGANDAYEAPRAARDANPTAPAKKGMFSSVRARTMPTELQVFGWD